MSIRTHLLVALAATAGACASRASGTHPEDMTATEHLVEAREAAERAATAGPPGAYAYGPPGRWSHWYPWDYYWDPAAEYAALAEAHRAAAEELRVRYESACALVPRGMEGTSPLEHATETSPLDNGVTFRLAAEAGPPDVVLAGLRCHRAWLMLEPRENADDEPLLLEGVILVARAGDAGTVVRLTVSDEKSVPELRRRAAATFARARADETG
jgi:hypothetical protein